MVMEVSGKRRKGRPKRRWLDNITNDLSERERAVREASARPSSKEVSHGKHRPQIKVGKDAEEEEQLPSQHMLTAPAEQSMSTFSHM